MLTVMWGVQERIIAGRNPTRGGASWALSFGYGACWLLPHLSFRMRGARRAAAFGTTGPPPGRDAVDTLVDGVSSSA
ncbi:hypothetical protein GCM10009416_50980 [Craurococcus roseus]|uniref:Uncharacterized protein n=1 Tax=Craurococcus roseus TaxID=77585 RepID=A0ABP3RD80_9PROT